MGGATSRHRTVRAAYRGLEEGQEGSEGAKTEFETWDELLKGRACGTRETRHSTESTAARSIASSAEDGAPQDTDPEFGCAWGAHMQTRTHSQHMHAMCETS